MTILPSARQTACAAVAAALLVGCGASTTPVPSVFAFSRAARSGMAPGAKKVGTLLYVSDAATNSVYVYAYPAGRPEGTLSGFVGPSGLCSNAAGDVFVLSGGSATVGVYAHGAGSRLRTLTAPGYPSGCSVDPVTGNLAVSTSGGHCASCVAVFARARGTPAVYRPHDRSGVAGCAYDNKGALYCDAYFNDGLDTKFFSLLVGHSKLKAIDVRHGLRLQGGALQWDGKDLAMGVGGGGTICRIRIFGAKGRVVGFTRLVKNGLIPRFWLTSTGAGMRVIAPTYGSGEAEVGYWNYPAGGSPTKTITGEFSQPQGVTLSSVE